MPARALPNLGLEAFFDLGEDGWKDEMDLNILKLSVLVQGQVDSIEAALPGTPSNGDVVILDEAHGTNPNEIAIRDDDAWVYIVPNEGWTMYNLDDSTLYRFNGTLWGAVVEGSGATEASVSEIWAGTVTGKYISPDKLFDAAAPQTLTSVSNATAVDLNGGINFNLSLDEDSEISNPTNVKDGQSGRIRVTDDGTGGWDLNFAADWKFIGSDPTPITTAAGEEHLFAYLVNGVNDVEISYLGALV